MEIIPVNMISKNWIELHSEDDMPRKVTREFLETKLEKERKKLKYAKQRERIMKKKLSEEIRRERTHRLCVHGADLEVYLKPEIFSDKEIRDLLESIFSIPIVREIVEEKERLSGAGKEHFEEVRNYTPE